MPNGNHGNRQDGGFGGEVPDPIPSPYNFVPLSTHVFFPDWAPQVSMDVPFSDGINGTLQLKVTARTPIYIRNGGAHPEGDSRLADDNYTDFFRVTDDGPYAVPGTSLKGMLRNVIEIASFGKIVGSAGKAGRVSDHRYAVRDLQNADLYTRHITETINDRTYKPKVQAAWLSRDRQDGWQLSLCDFARVEQEILETYAAKPVNLGASRMGNEKTTGKHKYQAWERAGMDITVLFDVESEVPTEHRHTSVNLIYQGVSKVGAGSHHGTLVFTGQPADRKPRGCTDRNGRPCSRGKHMEFIFFNERDEPVPVAESVKTDFEFAHSDLGENRKPNAEWAFWKPKLNALNGRVPVFVLFEGKKLHSMGLAMMYRFPYKHSIHETIAHTSPDHLDASRMDLGELLFGRVEDQNGLRGRIAIETLVADGNPQSEAPVTTVLNAPKPTYYPNYVRQLQAKDDANGTVGGKHTTYMDDSAEIRGWKRYIAAPDGKPRRPDDPPVGRDGRSNLDVATCFRPLPAGTSFAGTVHLHNLRPQELGALVWAVTWGGDRNLRHTLGMGKPYGFGSVTVEITSHQLTACNPAVPTTPDLNACKKAFTDVMDAWLKAEELGDSWLKNKVVCALKTMANPGMDWPQDVRYPKLGDGPHNNEFVHHRKRETRHSLVDPLTVRLCPPAPVPQAVKPPSAEKLPADKFLEELDRLSIGDIPKRIKSLGLDPAQVDPEKRKLIFSKLKKKPGADNWNFKPTLNSWKPG